MVFADLFFLYFFLPVCLIAYFVAKDLKTKNMVLIAFSLLFYAWGEPVYVLMLVFSSVMNWYVGLLIERFRDTKAATASLAAGIVINLGMLLVFKYTSFILDNINALFGSAIPVPEIRLPIGISFFTFQALSYIIDCYW